MTDVNETIYWTARPSQWSLLLHYGVAAILIGGGIIINPLMAQWSSQAGLAGVQPGLWLCALGAIYALWQFLAVRSVCYTITEERLLDESGVLNRITDTLELYRVKDTQVSQPIWLRPFGLGDIRVESSDRTTPTVILHAVSKPKAAATIIRDRVEEMRTRKGVREFD
jgi:uncharacterized membrane protein YdbT with pleckstrin-like domain|tara:strand:+ start:53411 stop:53914 length:504 start_codon:yes stop_codon:yes gene_type:complete